MQQYSYTYVATYIGVSDISNVFPFLFCSTSKCLYCYMMHQQIGKYIICRMWFSHWCLNDVMIFKWYHQIENKKWKQIIVSWWISILIIIYVQKSLIVHLPTHTLELHVHVSIYMILTGCMKMEPNLTCNSVYFLMYLKIFLYIIIICRVFHKHF